MAAAQVMIQMKHEDEFGFSCPSAPPPSPEIPMKNIFSCINLTMDSSRVSAYHRGQDDDIEMDPDELMFNSQDSGSIMSYQLPPNFSVGSFGSAAATPSLSVPSNSCCEQSETTLQARMDRIQISGSPTKKIILCADSQPLSSGSGSFMSRDVSSSPPHSPARKRKISAHRSQEGTFSFSPSPSSTTNMDQGEVEIMEKKRCLLSDDHSSSFNVTKPQLMRRRNAICHPQPHLSLFRKDLSPVPDNYGAFHESLKEETRPPTRKISDSPIFTSYGQFLNVDNNSMDTSQGPVFPRSL